MSRLFLIAFAIATSPFFGFATDPPKRPSLDLPKVVKKAPVQPAEPEKADGGYLIKSGQWFVIGNDTPLVVRAVNYQGSVTVSNPKRTSITIPSALAVGRSPDADDPRFTTVTSNYIYIVEGATAGDVVLTINPTTNEVNVNKETKEVTVIPFTEKDFLQIPITVDSGLPPKKPDVDPKKPDDPKPIIKASSLLIITNEETFNRSPELGKEMEDQFWKNLSGRGHAFRHFETNDALLDQKNYRKLMKDKDGKDIPLPAALVLNRITGEKMFAIPFTTTAALDAEIRKVSDK